MVLLRISRFFFKDVGGTYTYDLYDIKINQVLIPFL